MSLVLAAGLSVISASTVSSSPASWSCAYVADRLPRALRLLGDDTLSAEDTRAAKKRLALADAVLTRAASLTLARSLGATRLLVIRCRDQGETTTIEAQSFDVERPMSGSVIRVLQPITALPGAIDQLARRLGPANLATETMLAAPSANALAKAGPALTRDSAAERAQGLRTALNEDPRSVDLRLSTVEALIAARDFSAAIEVAEANPHRNAPPSLARALRFQAAAARLELGRYAEARDVIEILRRERETAAVLNNLGVARFRLRDLQASGVFERASFFHDHRQPDITFNRALALLFENKMGLALPAIDASLQSDPADVPTRLLRVWTLRLLNREKDRAEEWGRLVELAPSFSSLGAPDLARRLERIFFFERSPEP